MTKFRTLDDLEGHDAAQRIRLQDDVGIDEGQEVGLLVGGGREGAGGQPVAGQLQRGEFRQKREIPTAGWMSGEPGGKIVR